MRKAANTQQDSPTTVRTVDEQYLTVQYWRDEYKKLAQAFDCQRDIANAIAPITPGVTGADWAAHLKNINLSRGGLTITRDAVKAMLVVINSDESKLRVLKKIQGQGLKRVAK